MKQKENKHKKPDKRPTIVFRVEPSLKKKVKQVYGGYQPLEKVVENHMLNITPPSTIHDNNHRINDIKMLINDYNNIYQSLEKQIIELQQKQKEITTKINKLQKEVIEIKEVNLKINENIELTKVEKDKTLTHSIDVVTSILENNKKKREKIPCARVPRKVIKLYADNCNLSVHKFIELLPSDLHNCIENNKSIVTNKGYKEKTT